ncbi:hypothetical protein FACS189490_10730 [Clostridia bacterium]|nr:hypothetical protein FACS189490_10730 [Clostridia bacterium]
MSDYIIAIGGTGSRVVEAIIHLCDCGFFVSKEIKLLIIDADANCGNKQGAEELIYAYNGCREEYYKDGGEIFKTKISPAYVSGGMSSFSVSPFSSASTTYTIKDKLVKEGGSADRAAINLMKALYSKDEYEKNITKGFYARPSSGALLFSHYLKDNNSEVSKVIDNIKNDITGNNDVNIFVVASSFGGTGASGFPAVANKIRTDDRLKGHQDKIRMAGCYMLPYFSCEKGTDEESSIRFDTFNESARNALMFYRDQRLTDAFEKVYVLADSNPIRRGEYADEGSKQKNWPHIIELFAALAANEYFSSDKREYKENNVAEWVGIETQDKTSLMNVKWEDMPGYEKFKPAFCRFLAFNLFYPSAVMARFLKVDNNKFSRVEARNVKWEPCKSRAFMGGFFRKKWTDGFDSAKVRGFLRLYEYFNKHTEWVFNIISDFGEGHERIVKNLFGADESAIKSRHELSNLLNDSSADKQEIFEKKTDVGAHTAEWENIFSDEINIGGIFNDIFNLGKVKLSEPSDVIKEIIQSVYKCVAQYVK